MTLVDECTLKPNLTSVVVGNVLFLIQSGAIHLHSIHFDSRFPTNSINLFSFFKRWSMLGNFSCMMMIQVIPSSLLLLLNCRTQEVFYYTVVSVKNDARESFCLGFFLSDMGCLIVLYYLHVIVLRGRRRKPKKMFFCPQKKVVWSQRTTLDLVLFMVLLFINYYLKECIHMYDHYLIHGG